MLGQLGDIEAGLRQMIRSLADHYGGTAASRVLATHGSVLKWPSVPRPPRQSAG